LRVLKRIWHWNIRTRLCIVSAARGAVAFLLFLLPKPSVEAEQRQQMVPRVLIRSTIGRPAIAGLPAQHS
jgi:hypothetical protein